jgi:hypothetical protein
VDYWSDEWPWILSHWGGLIPGPGLDDFQCEFATIEEAVEKVLAFYFGHPTIIADWIFPLHLHPELREDRVQTALSHVSVMNEKQFDAIQEEREVHFMRKIEKTKLPQKEWWREAATLLAEELRGKGEMEQLEVIGKMANAGKLRPIPEPIRYPHYDWALQSQFLLINHVSETTITLRLRRDLKEVYVVSGA